MKLALVPLLTVAISGIHTRKIKLPNRMDMNIIKFDQSNLDLSTKPLDNFYQFVNGGWLKKTSIPSGESEWNVLLEIQESNNKVIEEIIKKASKTPGDLLGDMFNLAMNETAINKGLQDIQKLFRAINNIKNETGALRFLGRFHSEGLNIPPFFSLEPKQDSRNNTHILAHLVQGGLGLTERGFYIDSKTPNVIEIYKKRIQNLFTLAKVTDPKKGADDVLQIEMFLAKITTAPEDNDSLKKYNKYTYDGLKTLSKINWDVYFTNLGLKPNRFGDIIIENLVFFQSLPKIFTKFKISQLQNYLKWFILHSTAHFLPKEFHYQFMQGLTRCEAFVLAIGSLYRDIIGREYVKRVFSEKAKKNVLTIAEFLKVAFKERIKKLDWIGNQTKDKALEKLEKLKFKIGYPDQWDDYNGLKLNRSRSFLYNILTVSRRAKKKDMEYINKVVKPWKWDMATYEVGAYYSQDLNQVVLPAAILQPIFFFSLTKDFQVNDMPFNFGGIGTTIGQLLTHAFDEDGRKYDSNGNLVNWWSKKDSKIFKKRSQTLIDQFNKLKVYNMTVNGQLTLNSNIAELGGLQISYMAFQNWMKENAIPKDLHGYSPNKQFFIAYAQTNREVLTKVRTRAILQNECLAPGIHRVNQPLKNMQEFYDTFGEPNRKQGMYIDKKKRVQIW